MDLSEWRVGCEYIFGEDVFDYSMDRGAIGFNSEVRERDDRERNSGFQNDSGTLG